MKESPRPPRTFLEFLLTEPRLVPVSEKAAGCGGHGKCRPDSAPQRHLHRRFSPCRLRLRRGDARGGAPGGTCSPRPGGEDHLKRRRRVRRIVPSPPVPPLLGYRHCSEERTSVGVTANHWLPCARCPHSRSCKCRERSNAGVPGAKPPAK